MFIICMLLWILFNGKITLEIILFGIAVSAAVYGLSCVLFDFSFKKDMDMVRRIPGIIKLLGILIIEVIKANIDVIRRVYSKREQEPSFVTFNTPLKSKGAQIALADCITLTPGTITGQLENGEYVVHCLDKSLGEGLESSVFVKQLMKIEAVKESAK